MSYSYQSLMGKTSIRLLRVACQVPEGTDLDEFELFEVDLSDNPVYEALSYTWDRPPFTGALSTRCGSIQIPQNLADALHRLVSAGEAKYLWADAVCIDQKNVSERGSQVAIMGRIFQQASRVLVWLGPGDELTAHVFDLFKALSSRAKDYGVDKARVDTTELQWNVAPENEAQRNLLDNIAGDYDFNGTDSFYSNPWFTRLWIVQEIALARDIKIHRGTVSISWRDFMTAATIQVKAVNQSTATNWRLPYGFQSALTLFMARATHKKAQRLSFLTQMALLRQNHCSLDIDRVYALLTLSGPDDPQIYPDYTRSVSEVYKSTTEGLLRSQMPVLAFAGVAPRLHRLAEGQNAPSATDEILALESLCDEMPSWVADLRVPGLHPSFFFNTSVTYSAALKVTEQAQRLNPKALEIIYPGIASPGNILAVTGMIIDVIHSEKGLSGVDHTNLDQVRDRVLEMKALFDAEKDRLADYREDSTTTFARTIMVDCELTGSRQFLRNHPTSQNLVDLWLQFESTPYTMSDPMTRRFEIDGSHEPRLSRQGGMLYALTELYNYRLALRSALRDRTFFITDMGFVGLAPAMARAGDLVVLLAGSAVPMILSPARQSPPENILTFYLIGDCYVHSIMHGELIDGLDPEKLKKMWHILLLR